MGQESTTAKENPRTGATVQGQNETNIHGGLKMDTNVSPLPTRKAIDSFWVGTTCGHQTPTHQTHGLWLEGEYDNATLWRRPGMSAVRPTTDGQQLVRYFGFIILTESSGSLQMVASADATPEEVEALRATGLSHRRHGMVSDWDPSPCRRGERAISVCRYIDEDYLDASVAALFEEDRCSNLSADWDALERLVAA